MTCRSCFVSQGMEKGVRMARTIVTIGMVLIFIGLLWPWLSKLPIGRLPGDILIRRDSIQIYLPITTSILVSIVLSLLFWLFRK
jgi:ribose/xylose/arabinose/galactoside ABC-type transport system permease subunit